MLKWLIFIVLGYIIYAYWHGRRLTRPGTPGGSRMKAAEKMVACAHCGVHLPESEALNDAERRSYCSEEHRRLGVRRSN